MSKIAKLIEGLKQGDVAVIPTDTIYGLVASALNPEAVAKVYQLKGRAPDKPCIILISEIKDLEQFGAVVNKVDVPLLTRLWPGPTSIIFPLSSHASRTLAYLHRGTETLAFRLPKLKSLRNLIKETGPLIAPSANPEGQSPANSVKLAEHYFGDQVTLYLSTTRKLSKPSKLVALQSGKIIVLRV